MDLYSYRTIIDLSVVICNLKHNPPTSKRIPFSISDEE